MFEEEYSYENECLRNYIVRLAIGIALATATFTLAINSPKYYATYPAAISIEEARTAEDIIHKAKLSLVTNEIYNRTSEYEVDTPESISMQVIAVICALAAVLLIILSTLVYFDS